MSTQRMSAFQEIFKRLENNTRHVLYLIDDAIHNPNLRRLLSFFTIGKILNIMLHIVDKYKINMVSIKILTIVGSCTFSIGLLSYFGFPFILKSQVKSQIRLKKGSEMRDFWEKLPQPLDFNLYVFNVTNPTEIKSGSKPIVQEVGPFHYDLYRDKEDVVDREEDDTVEYSLRQVWHFNREKSVMSENVEIIAFHPAMIAIVLVVQRDRPASMGIISKALDSIFKKPESMFIKTTVNDLFFYGIPIDCTDIKDFSGSAVCHEMGEQDHIFIRQATGIRFRFGYLTNVNGTLLPERIRVYRGIKNYEDVGRVLTIGNETNMDMWFGSACNNFRGTDGTIFPPFLSKEKEVWVHSLDLCRSIGAYYVEPGKVKGFKTLHYSANLGDSSVDEDVKCFCPEYEGCMPKNMYNAGPCKTMPLRLSLPHFYDSDPRYLEIIEGVNPDPKKHRMTFNFEPMTGTPINAYKKVQFNVLIGPIPKLRLMKSFPEVLFPLFWVEDGIELGDILMKPLKVAYRQILIAKIMIMFIMLSGLGMIIFALATYYKEIIKGKKEGLPDLLPDKEQNNVSREKTAVSSVSTIQTELEPPRID